MVKEFFFTPQPEFNLELGDDVIISENTGGGEYLISNIQSGNSKIYAPEVNFYLASISATNAEKVEGVRKLYETRATAYDNSQQTKHIVDIGRRALIIGGEDLDQLRSQLEDAGFTFLVVEPDHVVGIDGRIGELRVSVQTDEELLLLETDQILWSHCPEQYVCRKGIYDPIILGNEDAVRAIEASSGQVTVENYVKYTSSLCILHHGRDMACGQCFDVCPAGAIEKHVSPQELVISDIDCIGCGSCVAVCPTGAMDSARLPRKSFTQICSLYQGKIVLIIPSKIELEDLKIELHERMLPLVIDDEYGLDEFHLLSLLQTSGYPIVYLNDTLPSHIENTITLINDIFTKKYHRQAVYTFKDPAAIQLLPEDVCPFENVICDPDERSLSKRDIIAKRLQHFVGSGDYGTAYTGTHLHYGVLRINQDKCTLCLSCADTCKPGALTVHPEDNTLRYNPSLCVCCGSCERTCPETSCLSLIKNQLVLKPAFFQRHVMARDEIFKCIECGTGFAPAKSIAKIAALMEPQFDDDTTRIKTLYCCPDCKAKVMVETQNSEHL